MLNNMLLVLSADFFESFVLLFTEMDTIVYVLFIVGIVFCCIELCIPGFGAFGILGCIALVLGIVFRMVDGGNAYMFLFMVVFAVIIIGGMFWIVASSLKKGKLSKTKMFDVGTAVPTGITQGTKDYTSMIGKEGITLNLLRPIGTAEIDGQIVDVISKQGVIEGGKNVEVIAVEGQRIVVQEK